MGSAGTIALALGCFVFAFVVVASMPSAADATDILSGNLTIYTEKPAYTRNETITVMGYVSEELLELQQKRAQNTQNTELLERAARISIYTPDNAIYDGKRASVSQAGFFKHDFKITNQRGINYTEIEGEWQVVLVDPRYRGDGVPSYFLYIPRANASTLSTDHELPQKQPPPSQWLLQDCKRLDIESGQCTTEAISQKITELLGSEEEERQRLESLHGSYWITTFPFQYLIGIGAAIAGIIAFLTLRKRK